MFWVIIRTVSLGRFLLSTHNINILVEELDFFPCYACLTKGLYLVALYRNYPIMNFFIEISRDPKKDFPFSLMNKLAL